MSSFAFVRALTATGYLLPNGEAAPGLVLPNKVEDSRLRGFFSENRGRLDADAVFTAQNVPTTIFKDAGEEYPTEQQIFSWHEAAWNMGSAPLLWVITPTDIRLYDCFAAPSIEEITSANLLRALDIFELQSIERLGTLERMCGRYATETGAFWTSDIGKKIDRKNRVDRTLLSEIKELEKRLTDLPNKLPITKDNERQTSRDFAQRLIGRVIFTSYLLDRGIAQPFLPREMPKTITGMLADVKSAFQLFRWLRVTFNGDLFPMDDPGAEHERLNESHLELLREFTEGWSLVSGQRRLFNFRFEVIPVDLISSIYQQFARSSDEAEADEHGLHYTPIELVHLTLDPVFEGLPSSARIIDPTCGSGAFLVEAFRRLVWKGTKGKPASRNLVRQILYKQLYGIDINKSALGIAAFSLYLAALELDEEPVVDISDLKFHRLINTTLFEADTVNEELPATITDRSFDAVVGNPPWTFVRHVKPKAKRIAENDETIRPRRSPDQEFLWVATKLAGASGRIGMIMKASPFFSKDQHAIDARNVLLRRLAPAALINLSALRKEGLFPDATGPALLVFARCALMEKGDQLLLGSIPWTPDFKRNGLFNISPDDFKNVQLSRVLKSPGMLKAATFGTARDGWLVEKLERRFKTLEHSLNDLGLQRLVARGQGFKVNGEGLSAVPPEYKDMPVLNADSFKAFRIDSKKLPLFKQDFLHRTRNLSIFKGPLLICPKGSFSNSAEIGRYSAAVCKDDILYNQSFYGISFFDSESKWANVLTAILNSSLTTFQLAFAGATWGLERPTIEPNDLLSIRVPNIKFLEPELVDSVLVAEKAAAADPSNIAALNALDEAVFDLYELERDEMVIALEAIYRARMQLAESRQDRLRFVAPPKKDTLIAYTTEFIKVVNTFLRAKGARHLEGVTYPVSHWERSPDGLPGLAAVKFIMVNGAAPESPIIHDGDSLELAQLSAILRGQVNEHVPPYLNERRHLRIYSENALLVLKPAESRYWTKTMGLNDADVVLADHWMKGRHAIHA